MSLNQCGSCVANETVNDKQLTVLWHDDDLKVSHEDVEAVNNFFEQSDSEFGKETPVNKNHRLINNYLGMVLDYINMILHDMP